jgi:hypothetical protein
MQRLVDMELNILGVPQDAGRPLWKTRGEKSNFKEDVSHRIHALTMPTVRE